MAAFSSESTSSTSGTSISNSLRSIRSVAACIMTGFFATSSMLYCYLERMEWRDLRILLSSRATSLLRVIREDMSSDIPVMPAGWDVPNKRDLVLSTSSSFFRSPSRQSMTRSLRELFERDFPPDDGFGGRTTIRIAPGTGSSPSTGC